ncbi:MAG: DUF1624 domain-containing protein [Firmicutes bacterium]|nr:DUF1624 domain-containing protein [Bacillota bacterium]
MARGKRILEIDALRGIAVLLMVFSHGLHWSYTGTAHDIVSFFSHLSPGDLAAPLFFFTAGLSLYYSLTTLLGRRYTLTDLQKRYTKRLAKNFIVGVALSLTWGVLQAQAITIFILLTSILFLLQHFSFRQMRIYILALIALALGLHLFPFPNKCSILSGQFPIFAILVFNGAGFYFAPNLCRPKAHYRSLVPGLVFIASALCLGKAGFSLARPDAPLAFIILGIGLSLLLLGLLNFGVLKNTQIYSFICGVGRDALFLFVFHYLAFYLPLYLLGFGNKMGIHGALGFASIMVIAIIITAKMREHSTFSIYQLIDALFLIGAQYIGRLTDMPMRGDLQNQPLEE